MRCSRSAPALLATAIALAACTTHTREQLDTLAHADSLRTDSLSNVRRDLLEEVMASTEFVNQINTELAKARALAAKAPTRLETNTESLQVNEERKQVVARISHLVSRLDSVQNRLAATRSLARRLTRQDSGLVARVADYEKTIADLRQSTEQQRAEFQKTIDQQTTKIAVLNGEVDTLSHVSAALSDTVGRLTTEVNTAYYIVGTKDELLKKGIIVAEGPKRFLVVGSRSLAPARELDPSNFTKIDRRASRTIDLPDGEYQIISRQNPTFAAAKSQKDGRIAGGLTISQPEQFWESSRFLIIVRS
jgi:predicted  nucleic acid-binding Zn-ribbon protein